MRSPAPDPVVTVDPARFVRGLLGDRATFGGDAAFDAAGSGPERLDAAAWHVDWRTSLPALPEPGAEVAFRTSGHTGPPRLWLRTFVQLSQEVDVLARVCALAPCDAVVSFAPLRHLYGFLFSFCVPALLRLPVWYRPAGEVAPDLAGLPAQRPLVVTIPSVLGLLERRARELRRFRDVRLVHSTSTLPDAAVALAAAVETASVVELFGSTETGLVASRELHEGTSGAWTLAPDVAFRGPVRRGSERRLAVRSPRIAREPGLPSRTSFVLDDRVEPVDERRFRFHGRRSELIKVNGRRLNLADVERALAGALPCADLACVGRRDRYRGESYDLLVVPGPEPGVTPAAVRGRVAAVLREDEQPRSVRIVGAIPRSATGKVRALAEVRP
jgi:acyl-coenzyme A synthetase/AMP-(fatty) acid ligase